MPDLATRPLRDLVEDHRDETKAFVARHHRRSNYGLVYGTFHLRPGGIGDAVETISPALLALTTSLPCQGV